MAIRDLQITRGGNSGAADTQAILQTDHDAAAPEFSDLTSLIQTGKGNLASDPQSGSILKILADNGFAEKIKNGFANGHIYNVWHTPPSSEFVLVDSWTDAQGSAKKHYEFFRITAQESATSAPNAPMQTPIPAPPPVPQPKPAAILEKINSAESENFSGARPEISVSVPNPRAQEISQPDSLALVRQVSADVDAFLARFANV